MAAIEFAAVGSILMIGAMNAADVGRYVFQTSEVNAAAQAGAQAAYVACDLAHTPATTNCPGLNDAVTDAIRTTRLGSDVTLGAVTEGYYCLDDKNALQKVSGAGSKPADCSAVKNASATPTLYLQVRVTYAFKPIFPDLTLAKSFEASIVRTSWMRMA